MCLVIDTCCLGLVFGVGTKQHDRYSPVFNWINEGNGYMIYGGTKYNTELKRAKVLGIVSELAKKNRTIHLQDAAVNQIAADLKVKFPEPEFDDEHIVALVIASRCGVVCTKDNVAISYLKRNDVFDGYQGAVRPKIFQGRKVHKKLC